MEEHMDSEKQGGGGVLEGRGNTDMETLARLRARARSYLLS